MMSIAIPRVLAEHGSRAHDAIGEDEAVLTAWSFDPEFLLPVLLAGFFYARGLGRWPDRSREHPWWRTALYYTGLAILVLAFESPIDRLGEHHFTMHMIQHELVMMFAVPFILLGAPTTPSLRGMPRWLRLGVIRRLARQDAVRQLYGVVTHPVTAVAAFSAVLWAWHLVPGWYDASLENAVIHDIQHVSFVLVAVLFWWNVIDPKPLRSRVPHLPRVVYVFAGGVPKHFLGAMLTFAGGPLYVNYVAARPLIPLTPMEDQQLGGLIMWVPSVMMFLIVMGIVFAVWAKQSEERQRAREAAADDAESRAVPATVEA